MALSLLDTQILENIVNRVDIEDKSNLFLIGNTLLSKKLSLLRTDISILNHCEMWETCKSDDEGATIDEDYLYACEIDGDVVDDTKKYHKLVTKARTNMDISILGIGLEKAIYDTVLLKYTRARHATIHGSLLPRVAVELTCLESLHVYLIRIQDYPSRFPSTLIKLNLIIHEECDRSYIWRHLPATLLYLKVRVDRTLTTNRVIIDAEIAKLLPPHLETLIGVDLADESALLLPRSLTELKHGVYNKLQFSSLPSSITNLKAELLLNDIAELSHFTSLQTLTCFCHDGSNLEYLQHLHTLTNLDLGLDCQNTDYLLFPRNLTQLQIDSSGDACCIIPSSIKDVDCSLYYNLFYSATKTWLYTAFDCPRCVPEGVIHAKLSMRNGTVEQLHTIFDALKDTVETFEIIFSNHRYARRGLYFNPNYDFAKFTKCTTLIHPW